MLAKQNRVRVWQLALAMAAVGACTSPADEPERVGSSPTVFDRSTGGSSPLDSLGAAGTSATGPGAPVGSGAGSPSRGRWPKSAIKSTVAGTVTGHAYDAVSGNPVPTKGMVVTTAKCVGCGPTAQASATLEGGTFTFPAASRPLTLEPSTTFTLNVQGYEPVTIAHGPWGAVSNGQIVTELPPIYLCPMGAKHADQDKICDAAEARYGTNPNKEDTDGDSLSDAAELYGVADDEVLDIRGLGVDPLRVDVLLEIDFMKGLAPSQAAVDAVVAAFNRAPSKFAFAKNKPGIALHAWIDDEVDSNADIDFPNFENAKPIVTSSFNLLSKWPIHYGLFAHQLFDSAKGVAVASSGAAIGNGGTLFFVTLPEVFSALNRPNLGFNPQDTYAAATLMHELGHNLGLQHGGGESVNFKPNYVSVMNSLYQLDAIPMAFGDWKSPMTLLDYARFTTPDLAENKLKERGGLGATWPPGAPAVMPLQNPWACARFDAKLGTCQTWREITGSIPGDVDFNGDGKISDTTVALDLNGSGGGPEVFKGTTNDWEILDFSGKPSTQAGASAFEPCPAPPVGLGGAPNAADGGVADGGVRDGGTAADGGVSDAGIHDAGVVDSGILDAGPVVDAAVGTSALPAVTSTLRPPVTPTAPATATPARNTTLPRATTPAKPMATAGRGAAGAGGKAAGGAGGSAGSPGRAGTGGVAGGKVAGTGGVGGVAGTGGVGGFGGMPTAGAAGSDSLDGGITWVDDVWPDASTPDGGEADAAPWDEGTWVDPEPWEEVPGDSAPAPSGDPEPPAQAEPPASDGSGGEQDEGDWDPGESSGDEGEE